MESRDELLTEIERLKRLLVVCAKQAMGDEGAIDGIVSTVLGEAEYERLWESVTDQEVHDLAYQEDADAMRAAGILPGKGACWSRRSRKLRSHEERRGDPV
jgi:hypothetical protein